MLKKTMSYTDFNGVERTEDFYFNLSKAELTEMQLGLDGGMDEKLKKIVAAQDTKSIIRFFKEILLQSYGEKSDDGKRFIKSPELSKAFSETPAYEEFFMELATNTEEAVKFVNAVMPKDIIPKK